MKSQILVKIGFDNLCILFSKEIICMKCQIYFSGKLRKYLKMLSAF